MRIARLILLAMLVPFVAWAASVDIYGDPVIITEGNLQCNDSIYILEQADADADIAAYGQVWVHDDTPCTLWFTDDVGTDVQLGIGAYAEEGTVDGQLLYWDHVAGEWKHTETTEFMWDNANQWVGIGNAVPEMSLHILDAAEDLVLLEYENADSSGPTVEFFHDSISPADNDLVGELLFSGDDHLLNKENFVRLRAYAEDVTDTTEDGGFGIEILVDGAWARIWDCWPTKLVLNDDSGDIDFIVESDNDTALIHVDGGNDEVGISTATPAALFDISGDDTTANETLYVHRNLAAANTDSPVVYIYQDNAGDDQAALWVTDDSNQGNTAMLVQSTAATGANSCIAAQLTSSDTNAKAISATASAITANVTYGVWGTTGSSHNQAYGGYFNRTRIGAWGDLDCQAVAPASAPSNHARLYGLSAGDRVYAINDAGDIHDLSIASTHHMSGQQLASETDGQTWEADQGGYDIEAVVTPTLTYDYDFGNNEQTQGDGLWSWSHSHQIEGQHTGANIAMGFSLPHDGESVLVEARIKIGATTDLDSVKLYLGLDSAASSSVSVDKFGELGVSYVTISNTFDISGWVAPSATSALFAGIEIMDKTLEFPSFSAPQAVYVEWIRVTQWVI